MGQVNTQYRGYHKDDIVFPGPVASKSRDRNLRQKTTSYTNDSDTLVNHLILISDFEIDRIVSLKKKSETKNKK